MGAERFSWKRIRSPLVCDPLFGVSLLEMVPFRQFGADQRNLEICSLFLLRQALDLNTQLLALLIKMTPLQSESPRRLRHIPLMAIQFG